MLVTPLKQGMPLKLMYLIEGFLWIYYIEND
jgi:hypothetical protein